MNVTLRTPMTREQFLDWAAVQDARYEFDGREPVLMNGGTWAHDLICQNIWFALRRRLDGGPLRVVGPTFAVATVGQAVRFPDAIVTGQVLGAGDRVLTDILVAVEVVSASSARTDRVTKAHEYFESPSVGRYVIVEQDTALVTMLERGRRGWVANALAHAGTLMSPEIGISIPVAEFYQNTGVPVGDAP